MEKINLGIFDIDGTIRIKERMPREIIKGFNSLWESGVITRSGITKATAVKTIAEYYQTPLEKVLVAGNDRNDYSMLSLPVGKRFIVGKFLSGILTVPVTSVKNPQKFGSVLYEFAKKL